MQKTAVFSVGRIIFPTLRAINWNYLMRVSTCVLTLIILTGNLIIASPGKGQGNENTTITLQARNVELKQVFKSIETKADVVIMYELTQNAFNEKVDIDVEKTTVAEILNVLLKGKRFQWNIRGNIIRIDDASDTATQGVDLKSTPSLSPPPPIIVRGRIVNEKGEPVVASILIKGTTLGTTSDANGMFEIKNVAEDAILIISATNIETTSINVSGKAELSIAVKTTSSNLEEVVINKGYYTESKRLTTGSVGKVSTAEIEKQPISNPLQAIQGRVPGITIEQSSGLPGSNFTVRIRGTNSLRNGNNPLYIIDGVPFVQETRSDPNSTIALYGSQGTSPLYNINPSDIESLEILKDADATAIYGSRGANGVILITTKKGKAGKTEFNLNASLGGAEVGRKIDLLKTHQYIAMREEAMQNDGRTSPQSNEYDINGAWDKTRQTDWQKELLGGTAKFTNIDAGITGGNAQTQFTVSGGYQKQGTVFLGDNFTDKFSSHFALSNNSPNGKFKTRFTTNYIATGSNITSADQTSLALKLAPNAPALYDTNGNLNWENSTWDNPLSYLEGRFKAKTYNLISNIFLSYDINKDFSISVSGGFNDLQNLEKRTIPSTLYRPAYNVTPASSVLIIGNSVSKCWIIEPQANWSKKWDKSKLTILVGGSYQKRNDESDREIYTGFATNELIDNPKAAQDYLLDVYGNSQYRYLAAYSRFNYEFDGKYIVNATGRRDGSSRFGPGKKFANFGAVGVAWIFSEEKFTQNLTILSFGKLRASFGMTGNEQIGDYNYLDAYEPSATYLNNSSLISENLFNPLYGWETNKKIESALDLGFNNNKILFTIAYYRNRSSNQLVNYKLPSTTGFSSILRNLPATVQNTGLEFEVFTSNISNKLFKWTTSINLTIPNNKLISFPNLESSSYATTYQLGKSLNIQPKYHYLGLDPTTGIFNFEDMNHDGQITTDDTRLFVDYGQKLFGGINNNFSIKGFELSFLFQFVKQDRDIYVTSIPGANGVNQPAEALENIWRNPGDKATKQFFAWLSGNARTAYSRFIASDALIADASYIRLKNVALAYQFRKEFLPGIRIQAYLQGQNIFTITDYSGLDPETGSSFIPPLRTVTAGLKINL